MSRGDSQVDTNSYTKKFTGVLESGKYSYKYYDKKTKEEIECPEDGYELVQSAVNVTNVGVFKRGDLVTNVYVRTGPVKPPHFTLVDFDRVLEGDLYGVLKERHSEAISVVLRGTWVTVEYASGPPLVMHQSKFMESMHIRVLIDKEAVVEKPSKAIAIPSLATKKHFSA